MSQYILAIDEGTTGSTVALMDNRGKLRASVNNEFPQIYPKPGWVEHDAEEIWTNTGIYGAANHKYVPAFARTACIPVLGG